MKYLKSTPSTVRSLLSTALEKTTAKSFVAVIVRALVAPGLSCLLVAQAQAAIYTWDGEGANSEFGTADNWTTNTAPVAGTIGGNTFQFSGSIGLAPTLNGGVDWRTSGLTFDVTAGAFTIGPASGGTTLGLRFALENNATITQNASHDQTIDATILLGGGNVYNINGNGSGVLTLNALRLSGSQQININRNVTLGAISVAGATSITTTLNVGSGAVATGAGVIANPSGNTTSVTKNGTGTLVLTAANSYGGTTTVSAGTLLVSNTSGSGTGTSAVIMTGGVLGGTGIIAPNGKDISVQGGIVTVGDISDVSGSGIVDIEFRKAGGVSNFSLSSTSSIRLDIWSVGNYEKMIFGSGANAFDSISLAGATLQVDSAFTGWAEGDSFDLFDWGTAPIGSFSSSLILPTLSGGLTWDTSNLYTTGIITVTAVPEPGTTMLLLAGTLSLIAFRRRVYEN